MRKQLIQFAGYTPSRSTKVNVAKPALTGLYFDPVFLLGYAANVLQHTLNDPDLAEAVRERAYNGKKRKSRKRRVQ
jgi:hypothetical protein